MHSDGSNGVKDSNNIDINTRLFKGMRMKKGGREREELKGRKEGRNSR